MSRVSPVRRSRAIWLVACLLLVSARPAHAKLKTDVIVMDNGDRFVGEVKKMEHETLSFKPTYFSSEAQIDWKRVVELQSQDRYQLQLADGRLPEGLIERYADGRVTITDGATMITVDWSQVVVIIPVETTFWAQLDGNFYVGYNFTNDRNQGQASVNGMVEYVARRFIIQVNGNSTFNGETDTPTTGRIELQSLDTINLSRNWLIASLFDFLTSDQQDLDLRSTGGIGVGRTLVRTAGISMVALGGAVFTREQYGTGGSGMPTTPPSDSIEGLAGLSFRMYRFKTVGVDAKLLVYPSISTPGRVRLSAAPNLQFEIVRNLNWSFQLYENFDSQPPVNAARNDFGVTTSVGWKF